MFVTLDIAIDLYSYKFTKIVAIFKIHQYKATLSFFQVIIFYDGIFRLYQSVTTYNNQNIERTIGTHTNKTYTQIIQIR